MAIPHLRMLATCGLAAACAAAGAGAYGLFLSSRHADKPADHAEASDHKDPSDAHAPADSHSIAQEADTRTELPKEKAGRPSAVAPPHAVATKEDKARREKPDVVSDTPLPERRRPRRPGAMESADGVEPESAAHPAPPVATTRLTEKQQKQRLSEILRADEELREGRLAVAMKLYGASMEAHPSILDPVVQFRWALCAESLGMLDDAAERYQMLADATPSPAWKGFARWGLARVLLEQKKSDLALRMAVELWLTQDQSAPLWRAELLHWYAHLLYRRASANGSTNLLDDSVLIGCRIVVRPGELLEIGARIHAAETAVPFEHPAPAANPSNSGRDPEGLYAQYKTSGATVFDAVNQIASAAHWKVQWSSAADQLARSQRIRASLSKDNVACLIDAFCESPRLIWAWESGLLRVFDSNERPAAEVQRFHLDMASRATREATSLYQNARWGEASRLAQSHLQAMRGMPAAARKSLEDLISGSPRGDLLCEAWFDLGKILLSENDSARAIASFEHSIDHATGSALEPIGHLYLGRLLLEANEPRKAILPLRRALALATPHDRGMAALTLGVAYLMAGQPQNTAEILRSNQSLLDVDGTRDATAFVSCLAQVQGGHDPTRVKYDMRALMTAISHVRSEQFFDKSGALLIAIAYRELGLNGEAADICRDAISRMPDCALRTKLQLLLVDESLDRRDFASAESLLRTASDSLNDDVRQIANAKLCTLLLERGRRDDAEIQAVAWLKGCGDPERQLEALRILGRCLELKGDYRNAALCYAGSMPHGATIEAPITKH